MKPLAGVKVLDLSRLLPGPMCSWYLRGLGADVVKLEQPGIGDYLRHVPPYAPDGTGAWFSVLNAGTRSVVVDLHTPEGPAAVLDMIAAHGFDVVVEGFRPGVMARLGLDPAALVQRFPKLVVASISGFGQDGPMVDLPGHDIGYVGFTGSLATAARPGGVPTLPAVQVADMAGGALTAAMRVCAALFARERTGIGAWLDVSMTWGALALMAPVLGEVAVTGADVAPGGELLTGALAVYGVYSCADGGLLALGAVEPKFQRALAEGLGLELPLERPAIATRLATAPRDHWAEVLARACATAVLRPQEVLDAALHRQRGAVVGEGTAARVCPPFPGPHAWVTAPAPQLGAHTKELIPSAR